MAPRDDGSPTAKTPPPILALNDWGGLRSALTWVVCGLATLGPALAALVFVSLGGPLWDRDRRVPHRIAAGWGAWLTRSLPFSIEVRGLENAGKGPFVIVANHQSLVDLLVLYLLPVPYRTIVKRSLFRSPLGLNMWAAGYLATPRRDDPRGVERLAAGCARRLARGLSILAFPEGSRSRDWRVGRFRRFVFELAVREGASVLPVAIAGTNDVSHPSTWRFSYNRHILIEVMPPVPTGGADPQRLAKDCRAAVSERVGALRQELRSRFDQGPA